MSFNISVIVNNGKIFANDDDFDKRPRTFAPPLVPYVNKQDSGTVMYMYMSVTCIDIHPCHNIQVEMLG